MLNVVKNTIKDYSNCLCSHELYTHTVSEPYTLIGGSVEADVIWCPPACPAGVGDTLGSHVW